MKRDHGFAVVTHGGAGNDLSTQDGCVAAAKKASALLRERREALDAAIAAVVLLEDDGRFNAGSGASLRMDGETVELDASVMDTRGRLGAVAALRQVRNPVLVARAVAGTPHWLLAGEGATRFARALGFPDLFHETSAAKSGFEKRMRALLAGEPGNHPPQWREFDIRRHWNYAVSWDEIVRRYGHGTVGAVARDSEGQFAVATSTGGSAPMLMGRVGDSPIVGCGFYAGPAGAVGATGVGEYIVRAMLAKTVYDWLAAGMPLQAALDRGIGLVVPGIIVGLIGVTAEDAASAASSHMPTAVLVEH